jgi:mannose-6-phosphate isomerase-like protein (cupin superfamily)
VYVVEGEGKIVTPETDTVLNVGDMLRIKPSEQYYFDGKLKLLISSSPAWYPEQYQNVHY